MTRHTEISGLDLRSTATKYIRIGKLQILSHLMNDQNGNCNYEQYPRNDEFSVCACVYLARKKKKESEDCYVINVEFKY